MTTTVVTSVASRSRNDHARAWLETRGVAEEVLILGANLNAANELARSLAKKRGAAFGWHRLTLAQLAANIASPALTERGLASISQIGAEATVARLLHRLRIELRLGRYQPIAHTPGFPRAITAVLTELRLAQLSSEDLATATPDLSLLLATYETELAELALADWPKILTLAAEGVLTHRLSGLPLLMLDVPIASEAELAFLRSLAARSPEILATVPSADKLTLTRFRDLHWQIEDLDLRPASLPDHALRRLQSNLFEESTAPAASPAASVEIFSEPGEGRECVEIARRALALAREGTPFDRMAVLLRSPEEYRANLEEAFSRAGIPAHFARGTRRPDPAGRAFYALLKCAVEGLSARRFAEYLSLGQVPDADAGGAPPASAPRGDQWVEPDSEAMTEVETVEEPERPQAEVSGEVAALREQNPVREGQLRAPRRWEQLIVDAAVIGSRDRWRRRLEGLANELRVKLAELTDDDDVAGAAVMHTLDDLAAFTAYALPLIDLLDGWPDSANWGGWLDHLGDLATRTLKRPDRVLALLAELAPIAPVGPLSLREVVGVVGPLLLERAVPPLHRYGKVFIGPVEAARGLTFDAVFVPGLAERMFPRKIVEEPILLDTFREQISDALATNQSRLENERLALALAVGAAETRICFSYPRLDLQAQPRPRVPSFYALEAWRATEGRLPDFTELARHAETATASRLGWPGPPDPADAIDSAEHDLAILDRLAVAGRPDAGAARYLVTANPHLARALRARYQRWGSKSWTGADGLVSRSELTRAAMARHTLGARSYSPTSLQTYAHCPYRFFLYAIHRLAPRLDPEPIDELNPLQRGSLIHDIQFELFARLRQQALLPIRPDNLDRIQKELDVVIGDVAARYHDEFAPAIERVWLNGIAAIGADLREWLRRASLDYSGFVPRHFELSFGLELRRSERPADPRSVPDAVALDCGIQLRGSIDLVERHRSGLMRVTDHKTGKADAKPDQIIAGGTSLQPLLYALAAEKLFAGEAEISCGRLYFCASRGGFATLEVALDEPARASAVQIANTIGAAIADAFLPAYLANDECAHCDYRVVCGPNEERRVALKPRGGMEPLIALRAAR